MNWARQTKARISQSGGWARGVVTDHGDGDAMAVSVWAERRVPDRLP